MISAVHKNATTHIRSESIDPDQLRFRSNEIELPLFDADAELQGFGRTVGVYVEPLTEDVHSLGKIKELARTGILPDGLRLTRQMISPGLGFARNLFLVDPSEPSVQIVLSLGIVTRGDTEEIIYSPPQATPVNSKVRGGRKRHLGTSYYDPRRKRQITEISGSPLGGFTSSAAIKKQEMTGFVRSRLGCNSLIQLPTIEAIIRTDVPYHDDVIYGLLYTRPQILLPHEIFEVANRVGDVEPWVQYLLNIYSAFRILYDADFVHMQTHFSNRGMTLTETPKPYLGDLAGVIDISVYSDQVRQTLYLDWGLGSESVLQTAPVDISRGARLTMTEKQWMIFQSLFLAIEHDMKVGLTEEDSVLRLIKGKTPFINCLPHDLYFIHTMLSIYTAFLFAENGLASEGYLDIDPERMQTEFLTKLKELDQEILTKTLSKLLQQGRLSDHELSQLALLLTVLIMKKVYGAEVEPFERSSIGGSYVDSEGRGDIQPDVSTRNRKERRAMAALIRKARKSKGHKRSRKSRR